ncbi:hypothetical protein KEM48_011761 [Puccinia striiformis f. sp. tritici PST-130]|nr:hypothetical protein KEM48_011761 [Puccinia striiformis f. sp. tritici PST-130]
MKLTVKPGYEKRKRTSPQKQTTATSSSSTSTIKRTLSQPESLDVIETDVEDANKQPQSVRRSWVWLHWRPAKAVCQVIMKNNQKCGSMLKKDRSSSTKNSHDHLEKLHKLIDPKASKKIDKSQTDLACWAKSGKVAPKATNLLPSFNASTNLLGCVAHVINLGAKAGMVVLRGIEDDGEEEEISMVDNDSDKPHPSRSVMRISNLTSTPDRAAVNLRTILKRIHSMCTYVRLTPQCREQFREVVGFAQPDLRDSGARLTTLKIDVSTRWNSTFEMFERAIQLRRSCDHCCEENTETRPYLLSPSEGDQAANVMNLLQPLSEATTLLCGSHYPTINKALPIYIVLMKHLKQIEHNLYNQSQLIQPATQIITKLEQYLLAALIKPVYICA